jgi:hypothetical protein
MSKAAPVLNEQRSDASHATSSASSSGRPIRPIGTREAKSSRSSEDAAYVIPVSKTAGTTQSTRLGHGDSSFDHARQFEAGSRPHFLAAGDFNGDGADDLAIPNAGDNHLGTLSIALARQGGACRQN